MKDIKISRLLEIPCVHLFTDVCDEAEDTIPILVTADTSVIKNNYYMVGHYYVYNNKNYVINILNCIIVSCYRGSSYNLNSLDNIKCDQILENLPSTHKRQKIITCISLTQL